LFLLVLFVASITSSSALGAGFPSPRQWFPSSDTGAAMRAGVPVDARRMPRSPERLHRRGDPVLPPAGGWSNLTVGANEPIANPDVPGANGNVLGMARSGNTLYIAGSFRSVGENSGGYVPVSVATGAALKPFPKVAGSVRVIVPDGFGGWYLGGEFTAVGGKPRSCLAQVRSDGSVSDWNPSVSGSPGFVQPPSVGALAIYQDRVYVGGEFRTIGGTPRVNVGCVDRQSGALVDCNLDTDQVGHIYAMAVSDSTVFIGGGFASLGGASRNSLAAVNGRTGAVIPWQADVFGNVNALLVHGSALYVAGDFIAFNAQPRKMLVAVDIATAQVLPFDAAPDGLQVDYVPTPQVAALAAAGDTLFAVGNFTRIGGQIRSSVAALDISTGNALAWAPDTLGTRFSGYPPPLAQSVAVGGGKVYVGGWFDRVAGVSHPFVAAWDAMTGKVSDWDPKPDATVYAIVAEPTTIHVGGLFSLVGEWQHRAGLAAIDVLTGSLKPWNPNPDGSVVTAIAVQGDRVFVSGDFANIGGQPQPRNQLAAVDTINGEALDWNPGANSVATCLLIQGETLWLGGWFTQVAGQTRNGVAAIDSQTGNLGPWDPNASNAVLAMARSGNSIFLGGLFDHVGNQFRNGIAAVDATTGAVSSWRADIDGLVESLLVTGNTIYVGGAFHQIGGQARRCLAAVDATTGGVSPWDPQPVEWDLLDPRIRALSLEGHALCVGGDFSAIGGQPRVCLAAVDTSTGLATEWDPAANGLIWSLLSDSNALYVGGGFARAGGMPAVGLAGFTLPTVQTPTPVFALSQCIPNPAQSSAIIRYATTEEAPVSLMIYDLQGRLISRVLNHVLQSAGPHEVSIATGSWTAGVYLYRLDAGRRSATRKMVIVR
jgi:trimeric autotransporter adhesin